VALYEAKESGRNRCCVYRRIDPPKDLPTILIIDDEDVVLVTVSKMLERLGYASMAACDGQTAIAHCRKKQNRIDMVLLDVMMPGVRSVKIICNIKALRPETKIFLSSALDKSQIEDEILKNADGYLGKPYSMSELRNSTMRCFNDRALN